jgi:hypothetical protein
MWYPLALDPAHANPVSFNFHVVARLRPGATRRSASAELYRYLPRPLDEFPSFVPREMSEQAHIRPIVTPLRDVVVGDIERLLWILLGATARDVTVMIARRGIVLAAVGVSVGLLGALAASRVLHDLLYDVSPTDPLALTFTCLALFAVAAAASWLPARRAATIQPMEALRRD